MYTGIYPRGPRGPTRAGHTRAQGCPQGSRRFHTGPAHKGPAHKVPGGPQGLAGAQGLGPQGPGPQGPRGPHDGPGGITTAQGAHKGPAHKFLAREGPGRPTRARHTRLCVSAGPPPITEQLFILPHMSWRSREAVSERGWLYYKLGNQLVD